MVHRQCEKPHPGHYIKRDQQADLLLAKWLTHMFRPIKYLNWRKNEFLCHEDNTDTGVWKHCGVLKYCAVLSKIDYTPTLLIELNTLILKLIQNKDLVFFIFFYYSVCGLNNSREDLKMQNNIGTILIT